MSNLTIVDELEEINLTLPIGEWDDDVITAFKYYAMVDRKWSVQRIANALGWNARSTVYYNLQRWNKNGALEKARELYYIPMVEDIKAAQREIIAAWPEVLMRQLHNALHSDSDFTALQITDWLKRNVIDVEVIGQSPAGAAEAAWAKKTGDFSPTEIPFVSRTKLDG
jgi:K+ transporter